MRSFWSDPYLWIHLAGLAALPIFLEICFLGLAVGDPVLPVGLELLFIAALGITPIVWMQWQRPFYIFSLVAIALQPEQLSPEQRKLLRLFKSPTNRLLSVGVPVLLLWALWQLYRYAPIAAEVTPLAGAGRGLGLLLAAIAFLGCNLFLQVPISVLSVLLTRETTFAATEPYAVEQIPQNFTLLGFPVKRILPDLIAEPPRPAPVTPATVPPPSAEVITSAIADPFLDEGFMPQVSSEAELSPEIESPAPEPALENPLDISPTEVVPPEVEPVEVLSTENEPIEVMSSQVTSLEDFSEHLIDDTVAAEAAIAADSATGVESVESEPVESEPVESEPAESEPVESPLAEHETESELAESEPVELALAEHETGNEPIEVESSVVDSPSTEAIASHDEAEPINGESCDQNMPPQVDSVPTPEALDASLPKDE